AHFLQMFLREFKTESELRDLLEQETKELPDCPENIFLENAIRLKLEGVSTNTETEIFGFPASDCRYIFFVEHGEDVYPVIHVRQPLYGHRAGELDESAKLIIERFKEHFLKHSQILVVGDKRCTDTFVHHLSSSLNFTAVHKQEQIPEFYMTAAQREQVINTNVQVPEGFKFDAIDVDKEADTIYPLWVVEKEFTINRLRHLPSICIRTNEGELAGWAMSTFYGTVSHLYVFPQFRQNGLGNALQLAQAAQYAKKGARPSLYVSPGNTVVYKRFSNSPFWTLWTESDEDRKEILNYTEFVVFRPADE
ncbi:hypothetical protein PMAYCL1PPCAC_22145, partial [Pristionchus mayeri]